MNIYVAKPAGETEAMLRELAPALDDRQFDLTPCSFGHDHQFELDTGDSEGARIASWVLRCTGRHAERCRPQYGPMLSDGEQLRIFSVIRDAYRPRNNALNKLWHHLAISNDALGTVFSLDRCPPLPKNAAANMGTP